MKDDVKEDLKKSIQEPSKAIDDISNDLVYDNNSHSYGKVNRNRQMYLLDEQLMGEENKQEANKIVVSDRDNLKQSVLVMKSFTGDRNEIEVIAMTADPSSNYASYMIDS